MKIPTPRTDLRYEADKYTSGFSAYENMRDHAKELECETTGARATIDTLREQLKADEKAAYDLRCILHEVAEYCGISTSLWPAAIAERLRQMKDDKDEIENMWEELTIAIGAQGPESDPLTGCDTNDEIHKRAMDQIKTMMSDEF